MKSYKNVELFAKNAPVGAYAAGCPTNTGLTAGGTPHIEWACRACEIAQ